MYAKNFQPVLAIVCPCYNEEQTLPWSIEQLSSKLKQLFANKAIDNKSFICLVDDGSQDSTWLLMQQAHKADKRVRGLKLGGNVGHQNALAAGLHYVTDQCDCAISIDIDLQDDLQAMDAMLVHLEQGTDIVFGVRNDRESDSWIKRVFAQSYYRVLRALGVRSVYNHADCRLLSNKSLRLFKNMPESNLYLRGIFANMPLPQQVVEYKRSTRQHGTTKYTLGKMLGLAWNGLSGFSVVPLRLIALIGVGTFITTLGLTVYVLGVKLFTVQAIPGWASTVIPIYLLGGLQLFALGVVGEYIGKIFVEVKRRPIYAVEQCTDDEPANK